MIDDAVHKVLSQNVDTDTTLVEGLLAALQKTGASQIISIIGLPDT